jgi:hypothetical protein
VLKLLRYAILAPASFHDWMLIADIVSSVPILWSAHHILKSVLLTGIVPSSLVYSLATHMAIDFFFTVELGKT